MKSLAWVNSGRRRAAALSVCVILAGIAAAVALASSPAHAVTSDPPSCAAGTTVQTADGPVCGIVNNGVDEWLGIPYAAPPVGALRWAPPQPPAPSTALLPAVQLPNACPQVGLGSFTAIAPALNTAEDCLYLNIIAPPNPSGAPEPVMVYIHGGGFTTGSGSLYDGTQLAETGHVIYVAFNYRLGLLGFLADQAFGRNAGDYGLQDQQAALRWVKHNIAAFGGNPSNVTIFGESAGGSSVCDQLASPTAAGLFSKAISQSGEYNSVLGVPTGLQPQDCKATLPSERQAQAVGATFAQSVGCGNSTDVAACLRAVPVSTLLAASGGTNSPILNGTTLTLQLQRAFATGRFNRVPAIMGTLRDENLVAFFVNSAADYVADVQAQYGKYAPRVLALYPLDRFDNPYIAFRTVAADSDTVCPALRTDEKLSRWTPVYGYEIDDTDAPLGPLPSFPFRGIANGSYHGGENQLLFGNWDVPPLDANQQALADQMKAEWTAFAQTGNPTAAAGPVWPAFRPPDESVMSLQPAGDSQIMTQSEMSTVHNCSFWDSLATRGA